MTKLKLNREFFLRHFGVTLLMLGLAGWFGYDGYVAYPQHDDAWFEARHLKRENAIQRQKEFMALALLAALLVGAHLYAVSRFRFEFDEENFVYRGEKRRIDAIASVDRSQWEKKGIIRIDGIKLDAWHHTGVKEFVSHLPA